MTEETSAPRRNQAKPSPPVEVLDALLSYDSETGIFRWRKRVSHIPAGSIAGCVNADGYRVIKINRVAYFAHRIAFKMFHRREPVGQIDHRDTTDRSNNRINNLREASHSGNQHNAGAPRHNTSGVKGVSWNKREKKWWAMLQTNGKRRLIGQFHTLQEAESAIRAARERSHGEFANHGANKSP